MSQTFRLQYAYMTHRITDYACWCLDIQITSDFLYVTLVSWNIRVCGSTCIMCVCMYHYPRVRELKLKNICSLICNCAKICSVKDSPRHELSIHVTNNVSEIFSGIFSLLQQTKWHNVLGCDCHLTAIRMAHWYIRWCLYCRSLVRLLINYRR